MYTNHSSINHLGGYNSPILESSLQNQVFVHSFHRSVFKSSDSWSPHDVQMWAWAKANVATACNALTTKDLASNLHQSCLTSRNQCHHRHHHQQHHHQPPTTSSTTSATESDWDTHGLPLMHFIMQWQGRVRMQNSSPRIQQKHHALHEQ